MDNTGMEYRNSHFKVETKRTYDKYWGQEMVTVSITTNGENWQSFKLTVGEAREVIIAIAESAQE